MNTFAYEEEEDLENEDLPNEDLENENLPNEDLGDKLSQIQCNNSMEYGVKNGEVKINVKMDRSASIKKSKRKLCKTLASTVSIHRNQE